MGVWRRWHRRVNLNQKRMAVCAALAASALPSLVMARGHSIDNVPEVPLVVANDAFSGMEKTKTAVALLKAVNAYDDVERSHDSKNIRAGTGKRRNRRFTARVGPLVVYDESGPLTRAFRNLPGVELCQVSRLNLLRLAPGGHLDRFIIWTEGAFKKLDGLYGTWEKKSTQKKGWNLPMPKMANTDLTKILESEEIKKVLRAPIMHVKKARKHKANPLKNAKAMLKLNPYSKVIKKHEQERNIKGKEAKAAKKAAHAAK